MKTIRLSMAEALVKYLNAQYIDDNGTISKLIPAVFGIFGHGNVTCLASALYDCKEEMPTYRGQNEQAMALAALGFTRAKNKKQFLAITSSIGPGSTNIITAAGVAFTNSLPMLILSGDYFDSRLSHPVLQQIEQEVDATSSASDCFKPLVKYWDRITNPAQIIGSLPRAIEVMLNPKTSGPVYLGLCQDTQAQSFDYPCRFFEKKIHKIPRPRACLEQIKEASELIKSSKKIVMLVGAGLVYSEARNELIKFSKQCNIMYGTTVCAKSAFFESDELYMGPIGVSGTKSINSLIKQADLIIAIGTRLQDFSTASWSLFSQNENLKFISINTSSLDASKHLSLMINSDAKEGLKDLSLACKGFKASQDFINIGLENKKEYSKYIEKRINEKDGENGLLNYANVVGTLNEFATKEDKIISASGGLPGELNTLWRNKAFNSIDIEYGYSCMGYEVSAAYGAALAKDTKEGKTKGDVFSLCGDGSYMMLNSEIYSSVLTGHKMIVLLCDNEGFGVINRLQVAQGGEEFNNLIKDCKHANKPFMIDFVAHAQAVGANASYVHNLNELKKALVMARKSEVSYLIHIKVSAYSWSEYSDAWWEVGVPQDSKKPKIKKARKVLEKDKESQRKGV